VRVIGGDLRGRSVRTARGQAVRPTASLVRETLFNFIGPEVATGCRFLDLCAGSGSVGIEALSRGAAEAVFVDSHPTAIGLIRRNLAELGLESRAVVLRRDALRVLADMKRRGELFDVAFLDPPYDSGLAQRCLRSPQWRDIMRARSRIYVEHRFDITVSAPAGWEVVKNRKFGETALTALRGDAQE
jgi:16S rRNA (guanine966-N2)-methyltransferase